MIRCDCCGEDSQTSGAICGRCYVWTWCGCGKKFCQVHHSEIYAAHAKDCRGWTPEGLR